MMPGSMTIGASDVLIVVDVQNDFCPGGRLEVPRGDEIVAPINRLAAKFAHVVLTQDWHPTGHLSFASSHPGRRPFESITVAYGPQVLRPDHCVQGTEGAAFHPALDIPHAALVIRKGFRHAIDSYSAFYENDRTTPTGLAGYLRERSFTRAFFAGLAFGGGRPPPRARSHGDRGRLPRHRPRGLGGGDAGELWGEGG
jgi:nicotinamidase/pyrazinamidase